MEFHIKCTQAQTSDSPVNDLREEQTKECNYLSFYSIIYFQISVSCSPVSTVTCIGSSNSYTVNGFQE